MLFEILYIIQNRKKGSIELDSVFKILLSLIMIAGVMMFLLAIKSGFLDSSVKSIDDVLHKTLT